MNKHYRLDYTDEVHEAHPCQHMLEYVQQFKDTEKFVRLASEDPYCSIVVQCDICKFQMYLDDVRKDK